MPSLFCISESEAAKSDFSSEKDSVLKSADKDNAKGPVTELPESKPLEENVTTSMDEKPKPMGDTTEEEPNSTPNSKKRKVTPGEDPDSKQRQQKKINQMTLSSFFFQKPDKKSTGSTKAVKKTTTKKAGVQNESSSSSKDSTRDESSPAFKSKRKRTNTATVSVINLDSDEDQAQPDKSATSDGNASEENTNPSPDNGKTESTETIDPANDSTASVNANESSSTKEDKTAKESSAPESGGAQESSAAPEAESLPATSVTKKKKSKSKPKSARKPKQPSPAKKSESSLESSADSVVAATAPEAKKTLSEDDLDEERLELLQKHRTMKTTYLERALEVVGLHRDGLKEETLGPVNLLPISNGEELKTNEANLCEDFPTDVVTNIGLIIEGSDLPLSELVTKVCSELKGFHKTDWCPEAVGAKIKLLSKRKPYLDQTIKSAVAVDLFEDDDRDRLWRWEFTTLDLLDSDFVSKAKKARTARKKVSSYHSALLKLMKSLEEMENLVLDPSLPKLDASKAKVSRDEEKVLKFERDAEKQRLADEAKVKKLLEQEAKKKAKEEALEAKKRAKEEALEAKRRKKEEAAKAREDEKRKKEEEKLKEEEDKLKEEKKKKEKATKQKASFRSFFAAAQKKAADAAKAKQSSACIDLASEDSFDVESFRSKINSSKEPLRFSMKGSKRSASAISCRKRRAKPVAVSVYKTVAADPNEWGASDYLEQTTIKVPNRYHFLSFHEDCRPAYRGTWSKKSSIVTGKNPFQKDISTFDYEYDSEAEWEEGDDEMGENVEDDDMKDDDDDEADGEGNAKVYDYEDGFCVADEKLLDNEEDADEDTKELYKKKMQGRDHDQAVHANRIRIIAPGFGGVPLHLQQEEDISTGCVEGFDTDKVSDILSSYEGVQLSGDTFCVDAFPQLHVNEENRPETNANANASNKDDYPVEAMVALARFAHHSTLTSKDKLIEELRLAQTTLFSNRAKATRKLDSIAVKKKHPKYAGVYWEVKTEILTELGLTDILEMKVEDIVYEDAIPEKPLTPSVDDSVGKTAKGKNKSPDDSKKAKTKGAKSETSGSASKKRKAPTKNTPENPGSAKKKKVAKKKKADDEKVKSPDTSKQCDEKKESPGAKDVSAGMKSIMAQFIKRSPMKSTGNASNDTKSSSTSQ